jgi:hypothetical protein
LLLEFVCSTETSVKVESALSPSARSSTTMLALSSKI